MNRIAKIVLHTVSKRRKAECKFAKTMPKLLLFDISSRAKYSSDSNSQELDEIWFFFWGWGGYISVIMSIFLTYKGHVLSANAEN